MLGREHGSHDVRANCLLARAVALPFLVLEIEHDLEWRRPAGHANLELDLASALANAHNAAFPGECDSLRPSALGGLGTYGFSQ